MKQTVLRLMQESGAFTAFRLANRHKALILTYHRFSEDGHDDTTSARTLAEQLEYLSSHYQLVNLTTLMDHLESQYPLPAGLAAITIDDGYRDAYDVALPVLRRYDAPATLFAVTQFVDGEDWLWTDKVQYALLHSKAVRFEGAINHQPFYFELKSHAARRRAAERLKAHLKMVSEARKQSNIATIAELLDVELPQQAPPAYAPLGWDQVRELEANGVEVASHTLTHPILTQVSDEQLEREIVQSKCRLEAELGHPVDLFCYPNGDNDARTRLAVRRAGYRAAVTVEEGFNEKLCDRLALRRVHSERDFAHFVQCTSGFEQMKNRLRFAVAKTAS
ncbi:MAG: polysaccharide deacetylase family protein [Blastocatellia bacterium]